MATVAPEREALADLVPPDHLEALAQGRPEEFLQPLMDLGYLDAAIYQPEVIERALSPLPWPGPAYQYVIRSVAAALRQFRVDALEWGLLKPSELALHLEETELVECHAGSLEIDLMHRLTALDGEFFFPDVPTEGELSLRSRQLQYRLEVLGMDPRPVGHPITPHDLAALDQLARWLGQEVGEVLELMADIDNLCAALTQRQNFSLLEHPLAYFQTPNAGFRRLGNRPRRFRRHLRDELPEARVDEIRSMIDLGSLAAHRIENVPGVRAAMDRPENRLVLRLLQVRLWSRGHYAGKLDSEIGKMTLKALEDYADQVDLKVDAYVLDLGNPDAGDPFWAVNLAGLFKEMEPVRTLRQRGLGGIMEEMRDDLAELSPAEQKKVQEEMRKVYTGYVGEVKDHMKLGRRIYHGVRGWIQSLARGTKRILAQLREGIRKLKQLAKHAVKAIYGYIREGLRVLGSGFHFLFSSRNYTALHGTQLVIASDYDGDCDLVNFMDSSVDAATLETHSLHLDRVSQNLYLSLDLSGEVLGWALRLAAGAVTWPVLALHCARVLRRLIAERWGNPSNKQKCHRLAALD